MDPSGDFLFAYATLISQGLINARYELENSNAVVDVANSTHIRLVEDQFDLPDTFRILAPMDAVKVVSGEIPSNKIHQMKASEYELIRKRYQ